jgi:hypothetical protein
MITAAYGEIIQLMILAGRCKFFDTDLTREI